MLGNYRVSKQLGISRVVLISMGFVCLSSCLDNTKEITILGTDAVVWSYLIGDIDTTCSQVCRTLCYYAGSIPGVVFTFLQFTDLSSP
jgi:hypothetical protein